MLGTTREAEIEPPVSKDARFELNARRGSSRVPGSGVGFRFVFPFFFLLHHSRSRDRPSPSLPPSASFFLATWVWSPCLRSLARSFAPFLPGRPSLSFLRQGRPCGVCGPPGPLRGGRRAVPSKEGEGGLVPSLTRLEHPPHHVLPSTPTSAVIHRGTQRRNRGVCRLAGGRYVANHVRCKDAVFKY